MRMSQFALLKFDSFIKRLDIGLRDFSLKNCFATLSRTKTVRSTLLNEFTFFRTEFQFNLSTVFVFRNLI